MLLCVYSSYRHWVNLQVSSEKWPSWDLTHTHILIIAQVSTTLVSLTLIYQYIHQFVLLVPYICITNSFRSNYCLCSLLYSPITVSFVLRVTTSRHIRPGKFREKKLGTGVRISLSLSSVLREASAYAMVACVATIAGVERGRANAAAPNTHTERTVTLTSSPMATDESTNINNIVAMTRVLIVSWLVIWRNT